MASEANVKQVSLNATQSKCKPSPQKCIWSLYDLDLWPLILKTFSAVATHTLITCAKCHYNPSTTHRDIASRGTDTWRPAARQSFSFSPPIV